MRYLLNSAVITGPGLYRYEIISTEEARAWIAHGPVESRIGYAETADFVRRKFGLVVPLSRDASPMSAGDEALVIRLKYRVGDPAAKGRVAPKDEDFEIGLLKRERRIQVINKRKDKIPPGAVYIGRPSVYGNPFPLRKGKSREEVIAKYREYFNRRLENDLVFRAAIEKLREAKALVCFCASEPCHGDVIAEYLEKLQL